MMTKFKNMANHIPPLNVKLLIKKSTYAFDDGAMIVTFDSLMSKDIQWHIDYFSEHDLWLFVDDKDDIEWSKARNKSYVLNEDNEIRGK